MTSKLFALDIGTRSVVGIILEENNDTYHVSNIIVKEHKERAMVDGQIHNVLYVAKLISEIKKEMEEIHGPLKKVSVAAAGRALKTEQASITFDIKNRPIFTEEDISRLELQAVQQAQQQLLQQKEDTKASHYYCVGYSVLYYRLDGEEIGSLLDQQGDEATIEVIATFLPRVVVESLLAALKRADLEMEALTLEPIAAINVLIPPTMRRLNVALVDIGAGTSDIAITDKGTVVAYGMVPTAGDEITEALSDHYLLDFPVAETTKRQLHNRDEICIQDILGFDQFIPKEEVIEAIHPAVENLATSIGQEILRLNNQQAPKAVMLVGGGSLTPNLGKLLGAQLQLPANRVAVRGIDAIQNLTRNESIEATPELVTPIGIAIAAKKAPIHYMTITVNEQVVRLFELKEMTIADAFLAANIRAKQLYGKPGHGLSITVNGQDIFVPGEHGEPAQILLNGEMATTKTAIKSGDAITLVEGKDGSTPTVFVRDLIEESIATLVTVQGVQHSLQPSLFVNGEMATYETILKDRDVLTVELVETVEKLFKRLNQDTLIQSFVPYTIHYEGQRVHIEPCSSKLLINGLQAALTTTLKNGDIITYEERFLPTAAQLGALLDVPLTNEITVTFQNELITLSKNIRQTIVNGKAVELDTIIPAGATVEFRLEDVTGWDFQDVFRFSDWQLPTSLTVGVAVQILRNGVHAGFDTPIFTGDILQIELIEKNSMI